MNQQHQHGYNPYSDTGWFGSKLVKRVGKVASGAVRAATKVPGVSAFTGQVRLVSDIAHGRNVVRSIRRQGSAVVADARRSAPIAASVASFVPGVGTGVAAGLSAASALSQGKSIGNVILAAGQGAIPGGAITAAAARAVGAAVQGQGLVQIATSAARGVVPENIMRAVDFGADVLRGKNIVKVALGQAASHFVPGSLELGGFNAAKNILTSGAPTVQALASARNALRSEGARRAFDAAVGEASKAAASHVPTRASLIASPATNRLMRITGGKARAQFKALTPRAAQVIASRAPSVTMGALFGRHETAGLEDDGASYRVEKGDSAWAIAKKIVKDGNRWRELTKANPKKKTNSTDGNFATLFAGEVLTLPASWRQTVAPTLKADTLAQARALLKVWSETDGTNEAGVVDYGTKPEDATLTWGPRDRLMLVSFINWRQRTANKRLQASGDLTDVAADELRLWAAEHASSNSAPSLPVPVPVPQTIQEMVKPALDAASAWNEAHPNSPLVAAATPAPTVVAPPTVDTITAIPADIQAMAAAAQASGNVATMRQVAGELAKRGYRALSETLLESADKLEAQQFGVPDPTAQVMAPMTVIGTAPAKPADSKDDGMGLVLIGALALAKFAHIF